MVVLTEQIIRSWASVTPSEDPSRITTLTLNGSRHPEKEKLTNLGKGLKNFFSLQSLDLSRNYVETLEGLDGLNKLSTLNIYPLTVISLQIP
jgi:TnpA family transposase